MNNRKTIDPLLLPVFVIAVSRSSNSPLEATGTARSAVSPVGCYADSESRDLPSFAYDNGSNTTESCISSCLDAGYQYAGTQYSTQCFCGNSYGGQGTPANCNMACSGDGAETYGGSWANDVYAKGATSCCIRGGKQRGDDGV